MERWEHRLDLKVFVGSDEGVDFVGAVPEIPSDHWFWKKLAPIECDNVLLPLGSGKSRFSGEWERAGPWSLRGPALVRRRDRFRRHIATHDRNDARNPVVDRGR
jgi:hypothetical protein